jgi:hypothetical protein
MGKSRLFVFIILIIACAHKEPPISKDRLNPRLKYIFAINNRQIQFTFSEKIDIESLQPSNFTIIDGDDTLNILTIYPSLSSWEIVAVTEKQSEKMYEVFGYVFDEAENKGNFKGTFRGSLVKDTISPWVVAYSKGKNTREFMLEFSEAMDTTFLDFRMIPFKNFVSVWEDYRICRIVPKDTFNYLGYDTTYYLYMDEGAHDISGNHIGLFMTHITPDTIYEPLMLRGYVIVNDTLADTGLVVLKRDAILGITRIEAGRFTFEVRDSLPYTVDIISGRYSGDAQVSVGKIDSIFLRLEERSIDNIIN